MLIFGNDVPIDEIELYSAFVKHLPKGWSMEEEQALFALQSAEKQEIVKDRLISLDRYLDPESEFHGDGDLTAARIGVGRRQLLNLIAKLREYGPTRALTPRFRNVARQSIARKGLDPRAERLLQRLLQIAPTERLSKIEAELRLACEVDGIQLPSSSSIRSRILSLRAKPFGEEDLGPFGEHIFIDQVYVELPISNGSEATYPILTLIIDQASKLIAGHSLMPGYDNGEGLNLALADFRSRIRGFADARLSVLQEMNQLTWVVAKGLEIFADEEYTRGRLQSTKLYFVNEGVRRHGTGILRVIGDRLPPFSFRPMAMERFNAVSEDRGIPLTEARNLIGAAVNRWNCSLLADHTENVANQIGRSNKLTRIEQNLRVIVEMPILELRDALMMFTNDGPD
ncbi:MAG: hypothetical protein ABGW87_07155 [Sphingomonadaceae bacterium]